MYSRCILVEAAEISVNRLNKYSQHDKMFPNERFITARPCCLSQKQKAALETLFILFSYTNEKWRGIQVVPRAWNKQNSCYLTFMAALIAPLTTGVGSYKQRERKLQFITVFSLVKTQSCLFEIKNSSYLFRDLASSSLYFVSILSILRGTLFPLVSPFSQLRRVDLATLQSCPTHKAFLVCLWQPQLRGLYHETR